MCVQQANIASITRIYGFYDECRRWYNIKMWKQFSGVFKTFVYGLIDKKIMCMHRGLSAEISKMDLVCRLVRPCIVSEKEIVMHHVKEGDRAAMHHVRERDRYH